SGHAGWEESGSDIVCAAVSAILQAAWMGLERVAGVPVQGMKSEGDLILRWPEEARSSERLEAIVGTAEVAIERISEQFPGHVRLARETEPPLPKQGRP